MYPPKTGQAIKSMRKKYDAAFKTKADIEGSAAKLGVICISNRTDWDKLGKFLFY